MNTTAMKSIGHKALDFKNKAITKIMILIFSDISLIKNDRSLAMAEPFFFQSELGVLIIEAALVPLIVNGGHRITI
jgi:hypothetical protein